MHTNAYKGGGGGGLNMTKLRILYAGFLKILQYLTHLSYKFCPFFDIK